MSHSSSPENKLASKRIVFRKTKTSVNLAKGYTIGEWIAARYYERFGSDEFIEMVNKGEKSKALLWWNKNVKNIEGGVISTEEFKRWFNLLHKKKPKEFPMDDFVRSMVQVCWILAPQVSEQKPIFKDENVNIIPTTKEDYSDVLNK